MRRLSVFGAGKLDTKLETVRRWNVTAVARKNILRESAVQREEKEEASKEKKKITVDQEAGGWGVATAR